MAGLNANISSKVYQDGFFTSQKRFPAMIAAWGTGKTMCAILKGYILSKAFKNNLGLIVRKNFTDLRDSTLKDFEKYTGLKVPQHTKEIHLPNGSTIMFRHGDEISGLQNINLGWAYIEQAEEFDSDDIFQMLRGRLRRDLEPDEGVWDDKFFRIGDRYKPYIEAVQRNKMQQCFIIANANGHNWCWQYWIKKDIPKIKDDILKELSAESNISESELMAMTSVDQYDYFGATTFENRENLPDSFIADLMKLKVESPEKYEQYVLNSHEAFDVIGSYFAKKMSKALTDGRIGKVPYDPVAKVFTFWDIGDIYTAIWFVQFQGLFIKLINCYYDSKGQGIPYYAQVLKDKGYNYGEHWVGPDLHPISGGNRKSMHTGEYTIDVAKEHGIDFKVLEAHSVDDRINMSRDLIDISWFDEENCAEGIDGLIHFRKKKNDTESTRDHVIYHKNPIDGWTRHIADGYGHLAVAYRKYQFEGRRMGDIKQEMPLSNRERYASVDKPANLLKRGMVIH